MLVFELTMPNRGSWNGKWSGESERHIITKSEHDVWSKQMMEDILNQKDFWYNWDDGWSACVTVTTMKSSEATKLRKKSDGFCGYDWMVTSILKYGKIMTESQQKEFLKNKMNEKLL